MITFNDHEMEEAMDLVAEQTMIWLKKKGMFVNANCPSEHRYMSEDDWRELKDIMYNAILSF
jgi:hypothetical protein